MMHLICIVVILFWSMLTERVEAQDVTSSKGVMATDLAGMCKDGRRTIGEAFCAGFLFGIKAGIAQAPAMLDAGYGCLPPSVTVQELRNIVGKYIDEHPENQSEDARSVTIAAIGLAFPCKQAEKFDPNNNIFKDAGFDLPGSKPQQPTKPTVSPISPQRIGSATPSDQRRPPVTQVVRAGTYDRCILENASAIQKTGNDNALDVIMLSCIREHEEPVGGDNIEKIKFQSLAYGDMRTMSGSGLIAQIYNGSDYNITAVTIMLTDKKTKEQHAYQFNQFIGYYRGPGIVTGFPAPQYRRFIRQRTSAEYIFPLEFPGVVATEFFKRYEIAYFTARGIR
jgi:hypothetical protein